MVSTLPTPNLITVSMLLRVRNYLLRDWRTYRSESVVFETLWRHIDTLRGDEHDAALLLVRLDLAAHDAKRIN